ncbi:dTDP-4-dehydrorhamnose reductase [Stenotrophomonas bentonitica]|mgnify:CR=1 FL=1
MTILVFGGNGQLGQELLRTLVPEERVVATTRSGLLPDGTPCERADFEHPETLVAVLERLRPSWVLNAAAYTSVDRAEDEPDVARRINEIAPGVIARWCTLADVPMVHYSTDYVFDGNACRPYREDDATAPLGVYGASKLAGEDAVRAAGGRHMVFRTAWVYAPHSKNFLQTMLRLGTDRDVLRVVADQFGTPTSASLIADATSKVVRHPGSLSGLWHLTAQGQTSWHGFAQAIFAEAVERGILAKAPKVEAITTADYPTRARRPAYSGLDVSKFQSDFGITLPSWQECLVEVMAQVR